MSPGLAWVPAEVGGKARRHTEWEGQAGAGDKPGSSDSPTHRDVAWLGDCDQGCLALADLLGWKVRNLGHPIPPGAPPLDPCPSDPLTP